MIGLLFVLFQDAEIERLGSEDLEVREEATKALIAMGDKAVSKLVAALVSEKPGERRLRIQSILEKTGAAAAEKRIRLEFVPKPMTRWDIRLHRAKFALRIVNDNDWDVVVWTAFDLEIQRDGKEWPHVLAMWSGIRPDGCLLESRDFFTKVGARSSREIEERIYPYQHEPLNGMLGWHLEGGAYDLIFKGEYQRQAFQAVCREKCATHADPDKPWNRAVEWKRTVKGRLSVDAGADVACAAHRKEWSDEAIVHAVQAHKRTGPCAVCEEYLTGEICQESHHSAVTTVCLACAVDKRKCVICAKDLK